MTKHINKMSQLRYGKYEKLREICKPEFFMEHDSLCYSQVIPIGECEFYDYGVGFLVIEIHYDKPIKNKPGVIRIWYATNDDGDYGGWSEPMPFEKAQKEIKKLGELYSSLACLPTTSLMNYLLKDFNIKIGYE